MATPQTYVQSGLKQYQELEDLAFSGATGEPLPVATWHAVWCTRSADMCPAATQVAYIGQPPTHTSHTLAPERERCCCFHVSWASRH